RHRHRTDRRPGRQRLTDRDHATDQRRYGGVEDLQLAFAHDTGDGIAAGAGGPYPSGGEPNTPPGRCARPAFGRGSSAWPSPLHPTPASPATPNQPPPAWPRPAARLARDSDPAPPGVAVRDLTKRFGGVLAVDALTFNLEAGSVTGFLGPN